MEATEKLFYEDSHRKSFDAVVLSCHREGKYYRAVLDRTAFFPEGGGQYADTGVLDGVKVFDVHEKENVIYHYTEEPLQEGKVVSGQINWPERFEKMQQHTGEHIVSGLVHAKFGYNNVGFHLGSDYCTLDFDGPISAEELKEIELAANEAVFRNIEVETSFPSKSELERLEYRSKIMIEGPVRIVTVPGYDVCACCAPHVKYTGEIGLIKFVSKIHYKGGERITMLCGYRALEDYGRKEAQSRYISVALCAKETELAEAVDHLKEECAVLKGKVASLGQALVSYKAKEIPLSEGGVTTVFDDELSGNAPRELMNQLLLCGAGICAVFAGNGEQGYRYVIGSREKDKDMRSLSRKLNERFQGRGGGKPQMVQGSLSGKKEEIQKEVSQWINSEK